MSKAVGTLLKKLKEKLKSGKSGSLLSALKLRLGNVFQKIKSIRLPKPKSKIGKFLLKTAVVATVLIFTAGLSVTGINMYVRNCNNGHIYSAQKVPEKQVVIIPGAYVDSKGNLCPMLIDRMRAGIKLYKEGKVNKVLLTGDHGRRGYDEVNSMRKYAKKHGIPDRDLFMDHAGFCTYDSMVRAKKVFMVDSAIIVTQEFHLSRALYIARKSGIDAVGIKADYLQYPPKELAWSELREIPARNKDFLLVNVFRPNPEFLGPEISIYGDGRLTYD